MLLIFQKYQNQHQWLLVSEAIDIYPLANGLGTSVAETPLIATARLKTILQNITPEERSNLVLVITRNPGGGKSTGKKYQTVDQEGNQREANPYIERMTEPFAVGLSFGSKDTEDRINRILIDKGMAPSSHPEGVFGFIRTGSIQFLNENNQVVSPLNLTKEIIENTFTIYENQQATALDDIINNFAIQQAFVDQVSDKMQGQDFGVFPMSAFPEFGTTIAVGLPDLRTEAKSVKELTYNTVDGVRVLFINDKLKNGAVSTRIVTDIEDIDEEEAFIKNLNAELATQPSVLNALKTEQRYMAVIKMPNGIYTGAPLKATRLSEEQIFELGRELVARSCKNNQSKSSR